jgi:hypothetical protein
MYRLIIEGEARSRGELLIALSRGAMHGTGEVMVECPPGVPEIRCAPAVQRTRRTASSHRFWLIDYADQILKMIARKRSFESIRR